MKWITPSPIPFPVNEEGGQNTGISPSSMVSEGNPIRTAFIRWGGSKTLPYIAVFVALVMLFMAIPALAQNNAVTDDDVNAVARQMYCPVCENIPLDVCPTEACAQWRAEIRAGLESGKTGDEIIAEFVGRYGDRVVGTPQDPTLRALSLVTPWLIAGVVAAVAGFLLVRWWRGRGGEAVIAPTGGDAVLSDDDYRARLERDLQARR